jgi:hypothetical protein
MMIDRPFRWQRAADGLHAVPSYPENLFPGDEIRTLCGITAILTRADFTRRLANGAPPPTCHTCTQEWVHREHLPRSRW